MQKEKLSESVRFRMALVAIIQALLLYFLQPYFPEIDFVGLANWIAGILTAFIFARTQRNTA